MQANTVGVAVWSEQGTLSRLVMGLRRHALCTRHRLAPTLQKKAKRTLDICVAASALVLLSPVMLIAAIVIKLTDGGPVLFWQERVGRHSSVFRFPKLRSMVMNAELSRAAVVGQNQHGDGVTFKIRHDPRITAVGRFIRRTSIDELPQLWCVLKGDMSLVGPRPGLCREVARYTLADRRRLDGVPGLTCFWQVTGRSEIAFERQVELDVDYLEHQNLLLDLILLFKTVPAVLSGKGAY